MCGLMVQVRRFLLQMRHPQVQVRRSSIADVPLLVFKSLVQLRRADHAELLVIEASIIPPHYVMADRRCLMRVAAAHIRLDTV